MYKGASRAMQHAHGVDRAHPSRGYIDSGPDAADVLPDVSALTMDELRAEQRQLRAEVLQAEQMIAVAKIAGTKADRDNVGQRKVVLTLRLSAVNKVLIAADAPNELTRLRAAIRGIAGHEMTERIFAAARDARDTPPPPAGADDGIA